MDPSINVEFVRMRQKLSLAEDKLNSSIRSVQTKNCKIAITISVYCLRSHTKPLDGKAVSLDEGPGELAFFKLRMENGIQANEIHAMTNQMRNDKKIIASLREKLDEANQTVFALKLEIRDTKKRRCQKNSA